MNVLVLNYEYPPLGGGAAPVCQDLARGMAQSGQRVVVVTMAFPGLASHEVRDGVEVYRVRCLRKRAHACMPWEQLTYIIAAERFLKEHLQSHEYDVCHAHFVVPTAPVALWLKKRYSIPYVVTAHGSDVEGHNTKKWMRAMHVLLRPAWRRLVAEAAFAVAPSAWLLGLMRKVKSDANYVLVPNGLSLRRYRSDARCKGHRILVMGRLQQSKNVQTILRAVAQIPGTVWGDWTLDVLGDGPYQRDLERLAAELNIQERVTFHGWVENGSEAQLNFLRGAAVYISASQFENCPMSVLEGIAAGCYPLLSDIEGHRQFFEGVPKPEQDEYFFPTHDVEALSRKLVSCLRAEAKASEALRANIERYDLQQITSRYVDLLRDARSHADD